MDAFKTLPQGIEAFQPNQSIQEDDTPSLLVVILDTNPFAWESLSSILTLEKALAQLLIFVNAHLALSHDNRVALLASHIDRAEFLYPDIHASQSREALAAPAPQGTGNEDTVTDDGTHSRLANSYRPFRTVDDTVHHNLRSFLSHPTTSTPTTQSSSLIAGALTRALTYINRVETELGAGTGGAAQMRSRVFVLSVSGEGREGYVAMMNCIFATQKKRIPIDVCSLTPTSPSQPSNVQNSRASSTSFLQQAADATSGLYLSLPLSPSRPPPPSSPSLLQYLLHLFLPPPPLRPSLLLPLQSNVDFRAACFCHKRVVEIGWVCGVCLSIFCGEGMETIRSQGGRCGTCGTEVRVEGLGEGVKVGVV
ncbi:RNA polymerase II transcription factor B subunit 4 [Saitoella coloradoensis]